MSMTKCKKKEEKLEKAKNVIAEYCAITGCKNCEIAYWCKTFCKYRSPKLAIEMEKYNTVDKIMEWLWKNNWYEIKSTHPMIKIYCGRYPSGKVIDIKVHVNTVLVNYEKILNTAIEMIIDFENGVE